MAGRALVFSDPEIIRLATREFIPVAENCSYLQRQEDAKGEFFRLVAEQGHYAGRVQPSATRQGTYTCTADGTFLGSINTRDPEKMLAMMREALDRFRDGSRLAGSRLQVEGKRQNPNLQPSNLQPETFDPDPRYRRDYPEGGLVLKVYSRDLPREVETRPEDWRRHAVNYDHAWFTYEEAASLVPEGVSIGDRYPVPAGIVRRLARFHLVDNTRGETPRWQEEEVHHAEMTLEVTGLQPGRVELRLEGAVRNCARGTWAVRPFREKFEEIERGYHCRLAGFLSYDRASARFARFDVLAVGTRWGGTEHNVRYDDLDPAPMAIAFELAGNTPADRTPPQGSFRGYWGE